MPENIRVAVRLGKLTEFSLYAMLFILPISKAGVEIFFMFAWICWIAKRLVYYRYELSGKRHTFMKILNAFRPTSTALNIPIAVFVFLGLLSTLTSFSFSLSLKGFFFKLLEWIMIYFLVVESIDSREKLKTIVVLMYFSMVLVGLDGVFQIVTGKDFIHHYPVIIHNDEIQRIRGPFKSPNSLASWLVIMIPLALSFTFFWSRHKIQELKERFEFTILVKILFWALIVLLASCLVLTYTRGAWIAALLSIFFLVIKWSKRFLNILLMVLILSATLFFILAEKPLKDRMITILSSEDGGTKNARIKLWEESISIIKDFPFLGCGLNTYAAIVPLYKKTPYTGHYPHNCYLHMAAESGILGLGAFLWILVVLFKTSFAQLKKIQDIFFKVIILGLLAGLFGFLAHSFIDTDIYTLQGGDLMWFIIGVIIAVQNIASLERRP